MRIIFVIASELAHVTAFPPATPTVIAYKCASTAAGYGKGYNEMKPSQNTGMSQYEKIPSVDSKILNKDCIDANTNISGLTAEVRPLFLPTSTDFRSSRRY